MVCYINKKKDNNMNNKHMEDAHKSLRNRAAEALTQYRRERKHGYERSAALNRGLYFGFRFASQELKMAMQRDKYDRAIAEIGGLEK
jgi:hypothetical protein